MALINDIYVWVETEDIDRNTNVPQHPVEKGLPLTDSVSNDPITLSISGTIVNTSSNTADEIISKLDELRKKGSLIKYTGRNYAGNFMITSFPTSHTKDVWGGANFSMELVEVRIAKSAYVKKNDKQKTAEVEKKKTNPTLEVGATVVFTGGSVYVSSDAKKAAANRGRQTCKITKINTRSWAKHQYHLISTDKKYPYNVYGWVDKANIEGTGTTGTSSTTNAGTQQVQKSG